ncbi:hypothetical protein [Acetitomaculum ruminis]|uniref:hypothetical protein n=1 Tax=Acetitomaculum ruminis TaxID=2382 RepID=UPI0015A64227|nr:hypothetical protein [Acetitomaculum ruminis]
MRQDIKLLIIATILQPDNLKIPYLCLFPAIILSLGNILYPPKGKAAYPPSIDKEYP